MTKRANIAEVKSKFGAFIRRAKAGEEIIVFDRDVPVARIVGIAQSHVSSTPPVVDAPFNKLKLPRVGIYWFDSVETLLEDRQRDRLS